MEFRESETLELKEAVVEDMKKEIIAFANGAGGKLYIGVDDDGHVVGVDDPDAVMLQISNMVRDAIKPDIMMFVGYNVVEADKKQIVAVDVQRGTDRPYYLAKKGLRPEGVYVRQGTSSVPSTDTAIRRMIKETDGDSFECMRSLEQSLTFRSAKEEFARRKVTFGETQMKTLRILNADGIYTNLGLLLSDQCTHTIKAAVFEGSDQSIFKDRREFSGSLLRQLNLVYDYIDIHNQTRSTFEKLLRIDSRDYPEVAVREALLNALAHRDYAFSASTLISIYDDRMELVSIGGLPVGVSLDDVMMGLSVCRNPALANVFYQLELIEVYGTGMRKIMQAYVDSEKPPVIETTDNAFKIILPNLNESNASDRSRMSLYKSSAIEALVRDRGAVTRRDVEEALQLGQSTCGRILKQMLENGVLVQEGRGKSTKYRLPRS
ncbi:MAG: putative DNA binding domain-containing protein [Clostridia bacterium]|nr:putative DNA binding domain-containing protein [Clostridia bacterium]